MATYNSWPIVAIPQTPSAPQSIEPSVIAIVSANTNPFTGTQQIFFWGSGWQEIRINMPPMAKATFQPWITWLNALNGMASVFQFTAAFTAAYPNDIPSAAYWRLKNNTTTWSLGANRIYTLSFECRQAI